MISGTSFMFEKPEFVAHACARIPAEIVTASEIDEIRGECAQGRAKCIACEDGMVVFDLRFHDETLELFVWIAVAFRHGAYDRQVAALLAIARELEVDQIAFRSRRRGWARKLGPEWVPRGNSEFVRAMT